MNLEKLAAASILDPAKLHQFPMMNPINFHPNSSIPFLPNGKITP